MLKDILERKKMGVSFEVFPPKKEDDFPDVFEKLRGLAGLGPDFISCTYGAGGSRSERTVEIASFLQNELGVDAIAHMTCVGFRKEDLQRNCERLAGEGVRYVLALRGDRPLSMTDEQYLGREFLHASDMVRYLKERTDFRIAGACYPEKHYEAKTMEEDLRHLREKVDAGAELLISQLFFTNDIFYRFLDKARGMGIDVPICAGIMPVTSEKQIGTSVKLSGAAVPKELSDLIAKHGSDPADMRKAGIDYAVRQILDLREQGVDGIHIYTMNRPKVTEEICQDAGLLAG